ncbi:hypothetical protein J2X66_005865 [Pseudomonas sp. 3296]|nr:hypothetical protein [Pseudomonas sp. 3296]
MKAGRVFLTNAEIQKIDLVHVDYADRLNHDMAARRVIEQSRRPP